METKQELLPKAHMRLGFAAVVAEPALRSRRLLPV